MTLKEKLQMKTENTFSVTMKVLLLLFIVALITQMNLVLYCGMTAIVVLVYFIVLKKDFNRIKELTRIKVS